jgi:hypothetical protein
MATIAPAMILTPVAETLLGEVLAMGFPELRVRKAIMQGASNVEAAVNWVIEHSDSAEIDAPIPLIPKGGTVAASGTARSWKCAETGRLFRSMEDVQMYAEKTGRSNFEETTEEKKPLTKEEIAAKKEALKQRLEARRSEKETVEKVDEVVREKQRRMMGKEMVATQEQMLKDQRSREFALQKREKEMQKIERERLRAEIAKDKAERKSRGGTLSSVLGMDGYNPSGMSAQIAAELDRDEHSGPVSTILPAIKTATGGVASVEDPSATIDKCIETISKYKVGGDGLNCLKLLEVYVKNVVEKPDDAKYRSIKTDSNAFKTKVAPLVGGIALLRALGFEKNGDSLDLSLEARDLELIGGIREKLAAAVLRNS